MYKLGCVQPSLSSTVGALMCSIVYSICIWDSGLPQRRGKDKNNLQRSRHSIHFTDHIKGIYNEGAPNSTFKGTLVCTTSTIN